MKRNELQIGKVYAYSRYSYTPTSSYHIGAVMVADLKPNKFHKGEILVRSIQADGKPAENTFWVASRKLVGKYDEVLHNIELNEKNKEISRLKKELKAKDTAQAIEKMSSVWKEHGVSYYDIRPTEYGSDTLTVRIGLKTLEKITDMVYLHPMFSEDLKNLREELYELKNKANTEVVA